MFRVTLSSLVLVSLALATSGAAATHPAQPAEPSGDCVVLTLVSTQSAEAAADVYITKASDAPRPPSDPTAEDLLPYAGELGAYALAHVATMPSDANDGGDVMVELIFPRSEEADVDGLRVSVLVSVEYCALP